tara:strand:+ start:57 stop:518 length:462 start_codon:yes stop_codon:yes gene_type:complete
MDKRKFNGGSRKNAGRKKGGEFSNLLKKYVDEFMIELLKDEQINNKIQNDLKQISLTSGFIYIIKDIDRNTIKIGVTQVSNPKKRLSQYTSHKINFELLFIEELENCYEVENEIHLSVEDNRIKGDWFSIDDLILLSIIKLINKRKYEKIYYG